MMDEKSVNVKKIMSEIISEADGISANDIPDFDHISDEEKSNSSAEVRDYFFSNDLYTVNSDFRVDYNKAVDIGSPIRAKLGSMIRVRISPLLEKRNLWAASVVRILNALSDRTDKIERTLNNDEIERLKFKLEETEAKLFFAVRQMEVMNSRITELEKALDKKDGSV